VGLHKRRFPIGAGIIYGSGAHFSVWAPSRRRVTLVIENSNKPNKEIELASEDSGYFTVSLPGTFEGTLYRFRLDNDKELYPDPASRFQPSGPDGPSQIIDPLQYRWSGFEWKGITLHGQVLYEMYIGTFTRDGTWESACLQLKELADLGVTAVELTPLADFPGRFGWGV